MDDVYRLYGIPPELQLHIEAYKSRAEHEMKFKDTLKMIQDLPEWMVECHKVFPMCDGRMMTRFLWQELSFVDDKYQVSYKYNLRPGLCSAPVHGAYLRSYDELVDMFKVCHKQIFSRT